MKNHWKTTEELMKNQWQTKEEKTTKKVFFHEIFAFFIKIEHLASRSSARRVNYKFLEKKSHLWEQIVRFRSKAKNHFSKLRAPAKP